MELKYLSQDTLDVYILSAIKKDVGDGNHSSLASIPAEVEPSLMRIGSVKTIPLKY